MTEIREEMEQLIWSLAEGEREGSFRRWTSIIPWRNKQRSEQQLMLDTFDF